MVELIFSYCFLKACLFIRPELTPMPTGTCYAVALVIERARRGVAGHCLPVDPNEDSPSETIFAEIHHG